MYTEKFQYAYTFHLTTNSRGLLKTNGCFKETKLNKLACYEKQDRGYWEKTPVTEMMDRARQYSMSNQSKLFFSSKSTMPRDSVRSTYKIVRSPEAADYIVIPNKTDSMRSKSYHLLFSSTATFGGTDTVYLCMVKFSEEALKAGHLTSITGKITHENIMDHCVSYLMDYLAVIPPDADITNKELWCRTLETTYDWNDKYIKYNNVWFLPDVPEYFDIMENKYPGYKYVFDTQLEYESSNKFTPEGLYILRRNSDRRLVMQILSTMDWKRHPLTTAVFIYSFLGADYVSTYDIPTSCSFMKDYLKIGSVNSSWKDWCNHYAKGQLFSAEDYNFLQDWLFRELDMKEDKGFVDYEAFQTLPKPMQEMFISRMAIKKGKVDKQVDFQTIKQSC